MKYYSAALFMILFGTEMVFAQYKSVGITFSADYCYAMQKNNSKSSYYSYSRKVQRYFGADYGFTAGFALLFQDVEKRTFDIGIVYMKHHMSYEEDASIFVTDYKSSGWSIPAHYKVDIYRHMISVPINWTFYLLTLNNTKLYTGMGLAPSFVVDAKSHYDIQSKDMTISASGTTTAPKFYRSAEDNFFLGGTIALGVSHHFADDLELRIAPTFKVMTSLTGLRDDYLVFPGFVGVNSGLYYRF